MQYCVQQITVHLDLLSDPAAALHTSLITLAASTRVKMELKLSQLKTGILDCLNKPHQYLQHLSENTRASKACGSECNMQIDTFSK